MRKEVVEYLSEKDEEFVKVLIDIGMRRTVALVLVFLINKPEITSRDIERGVDLRQPEVSLAIKYMAEQGWVTSTEIPSEKKGRPNKKYMLTVNVKDIITCIEKNTKNEVNRQLALIKKLRDQI